MPCEHVGGAIVCMPKGRKRRCCIKGCTNEHTALCDFPEPVKTNVRSIPETCDRPLCADHAVHVRGKDVDYCPTHPQVQAMLARRSA